MFPELFLAAICLSPLAYLLFQIHFERRKAKLSKKSPFTDLLLRPAGESLRLKLKEMDEKLTDHLLPMTLLPLGLAVMLLLWSPAIQSNWELVVLAPMTVAVVGIPYVIWGHKVPKLIKEIRDHELGFQGERYVGEELNQLLQKGFRVYHDLVFDNFNIDHVIVGPPGVYAIETKTRRKPIGKKGKATHKVIFDGANLHYPWGTDDHGLKQAKLNADHLGTWLSSATGEKVKAEAILTFPGWWVERTGRGAVHVVNTKEIPKIFPRPLSSPLSPEQIQRIAHQIEQKWRNLVV